MFAFRDAIPAVLTLIWVLPWLVRGTKEEQQAIQMCAQGGEKSPQEQLGQPWAGAVDLQTQELDSTSVCHSCISGGEGPAIPKHLGAPSTASALDVQETFRDL